MKSKEAVKLIEQFLPNKYQIHLYRDKGRTRRFEVTLHHKEDLSDEGTFIYSKDEVGKFPFSKKEGLFEDFKKSLKQF